MSVASLRQAQALEQLFLYRLAQLSNAGRVPVVRLCEQHGITRREWRLLGLLAQAEGIGPSALALRALLDRARTSRALGSLQQKGLLRRVPVPGNRREAQLHLSDSGRALHQRLLPQVAAINAELLAVLTDAELAVLDQALQRLTAQALAAGRV